MSNGLVSSEYLLCKPFNFKAEVLRPNIRNLEEFRRNIGILRRRVGGAALGGGPCIVVEALWEQLVDSWKGCGAEGIAQAVLDLEI